MLTSLRSLSIAVLVTVTAGCVAADDPGDVAGEDTSRMATTGVQVTLPAVQHLENWDGRTPFYTTPTARAATLYGRAAVAGRFRAFGVDVQHGRVVFQIDGP